MRFPSFRSKNEFKSAGGCTWKATYVVEGTLTVRSTSALQTALVEFDQDMHDSFCIPCQEAQKENDLDG